MKRLFFILLLLIPVEALALNPTLVNLANNTWVKLTPNTRNTTGLSAGYIYDPATNLPARTVISSNPIGRSFSGLAGGGGYVYNFGGGHASYPGNDVDLYDIANNIWNQQYQPEICPRDSGGKGYANENPTGCWGSVELTEMMQAHTCGLTIYSGSWVSCITAGGRPYIGHTYGQQTYDAYREKFVGVYGSGGTGGYGYSGLWSFDPSNATWTKLNGAVPGEFSNVNIGAISYDPVLQTEVYVNNAVDSGTSERHAWIYNYGANTWTKKATSPLGSGESYATYDVLHAVHVFTNSSGTMYVYDSSANTFTQVPSVPSAIQGAKALAYDPINHVVLFVKSPASTGAPIMYIHSGTWDSNGVWTQLRNQEVSWNGLSKCQKFGIRSSGYGSLIYDTTHQVFIFLNTSDVGGCSLTPVGVQPLPAPRPGDTVT